MIDGSTQFLSAAKIALAARRLRGDKDASLLQSDPIALVGIGCRFPGGASSADGYWRVLREAVDTISEIPAERWNGADYYHSDAFAPGKTNTRWGGFVENVDRFDPVLFGIAPREAANIDPQQRLLLEVTWEALWDSGRSLASLSGSQTGVFVAITGSDYERLSFATADGIGPQTCSGVFHSVAAGRISYLLNLSGPALSIDTACSSSLVAVHLACQSLRSGECGLALAGGVVLHLSPEHYVGLAKLGMLSPDGRCKAFDASANGFVPSDGSGMVVLKRLSDALADGDPVYAVIRGTAANQDGRTNVLTAPNGLAQQRVVQAALQNARVSPGSISFVETHGTGTALGDPIEVEALAAVLGSSAEHDQPCALGAAKSVIGHTEAAAGVAGLIKAALALHHGEIPPNLHFRNLNPHISLEGTRFVIPTAVMPWPRAAAPRRAGVSSFGFSGTNAHVVLEEAPLLPQTIRKPEHRSVESGRPWLLPISARTPEALRDFAAAYRTLFSEPGLKADLHAVCQMAAMRRDHYEERLALTARTPDQLCSLLDRFLEGASHQAIARGRAHHNEGIVFVCSGQGSQWARMGVSLADAEPMYRTALEECEESVRRFAGWSLMDVLAADDEHSRLSRTEYAQPAICAIEIALARLWRSWGVIPSVVVGHSAGEIAAAQIAGVLKLEEAIRIAVRRGQIMEAAAGMGRMAMVRLPAAVVAKDLKDYGSGVSIAAINSPESTVISGDLAAVDELLSVWRKRRVGSILIAGDYPFHSGHMQSFNEELVRGLGNVETFRQTIPIISSTLGRLAEGEEFDGSYWGRNLRRPVLFASGVQAAVERGGRTFLEISPHPVLLSSLRECPGIRANRENLISSLRRGQNDVDAMLSSAATLYAAGHPLAWKSFYPKKVAPVALPTYPFQRQRFWIEGSPKTTRKPVQPLHPTRLRSPLIRGDAFESQISAGSLTYLDDHRIEGVVLFPMSAFLEMARYACREARGREVALVDLVVSQPLEIPPRKERTIQVIIEDDEFRIFSLQGEIWNQHVSGRIAELTPMAATRDRWPGNDLRDSAAHYARLRRQGADFGPAFQTLTALHAKAAEAWGQVQLQDSETKQSEDYRLHPALLDGCLQAAIAATSGRLEGTYLPFSIDRFETFRMAGHKARVHARLLPSHATGILRADVEITGEDGGLIALVTGLLLKRRIGRSANGIYELQWRKAAPGPPVEATRGTWAIFPENDIACVTLGDPLEETLRGQSQPARIFESGELPVAGEKIRGIVCILCPSTDQIEQTAMQGSRTMLSLVQDVLRRFPSEPPQIWLITRGAMAVNPASPSDGYLQAGVWGLLRTIASEHPELRFARADLDPTRPDFAALAREMTSWDGEDEVAFRDGQRYVSRLEHKPRRNEEPQRWIIPQRGSIENLRRQTLCRRAPKADEVEVEVETNSLNFRDVLNVLGMYPGDPGPLGLEFCGRISRVGAGIADKKIGHRVMGVAWGSFASFVTTSESAVIPVPTGLSSVEAATVPNAFLTAYHCLIHIGRIQRGQRVLIHSAAGGVGLAAVRIAQQAGAEIIATAGTEEKREYLRAQGIKHVFNSRSLDFSSETLVATQGKGVDVVLNSLAGDFISAGFGALAEEGRFVEIGKTGIWSREQVVALGRSVRYSVVDLGAIMESDPALIQSHLRHIARSIEEGELHPLPACVFDFNEAPLAFHYMARARHTGRIVLRHQADLRISGDRSYLITGGLGAIGLRTAEWMVERGARNIILVGRSAPSPDAIAVVETLRAKGARIEIRAADVAVRDQLENVIHEIPEIMPRLGGVVHAAGILDDGVVERQTWTRMERVMAPKVTGAWNLHELTANAPLDFFLLFSSIASIIGSPSQATYAAGNAFLDGLAHYRWSRGLPALSVNWGAWDGMGMAATVEKQGRRRVLPGIRPMSPRACLDTLGEAAARGCAQIAIVDADWNQLEPAPRLISGLLQRTPASPAHSRQPDILAQLESTPDGNRRRVMVDFLRKGARRVLGFSDSQLIDERQPLIRMGLDSLMAVEFRNDLAAALQRPLSATLLFDYPTIGELADLFGERPAPAQETRDPLLEELKALSEEEAQALLEEELEQR